MKACVHAETLTHGVCLDLLLCGELCGDVLPALAFPSNSPLGPPGSPVCDSSDIVSSSYSFVVHRLFFFNCASFCRESMELNKLNKVVCVFAIDSVLCCRFRRLLKCQSLVL